MKSIGGGLTGKLQNEFEHQECCSVFVKRMAEKTVDEQMDKEDISCTGTEVTTSHYVPKTARDKCKNATCGQSFVQPYNLRRPHHCRRCGEIFCRPCLQYKRRLNTMAQPDENGALCKVCLTCFEDRVVNFGCTKRSQTELFLLLRKQIKAEMTDIVYEYAIVTRGISKQPAFWKEQFNIDILKECLRLLQGFKSSVGKSETLKTVHEIKNHMNVPAWQRSTFWTLESHHSKCRQCDGKLGHRKKIRNCRVCGLTLCKFCSQKDLLIYFEDEKEQNKDDTAQLAIIRYQGCPDTEPRISLLLYCCNDCKEDIINRQIEDERWYQQKPKPPDIEAEMVRMDGHFCTLKEDIRADMEKLSSALENQDEIPDEISEADITDGLLEFESRRSKIKLHGQKIQMIRDNVHRRLLIYWNMYSELKDVLKSNSDKLTRRNIDFVMNYFTAKKDFYVHVKAELGSLS